MKRLGLLIAVLIGAVTMHNGGVLAQVDTTETVDSTWHIILSQELFQPCLDYEYNAKQLIPKWRSQQKFDFIFEALDYIDAACFKYGYTLKTRILVGIQSGRFSEAYYDAGVYDSLPKERFSDFIRHRDVSEPPEVAYLSRTAIGYLGWSLLTGYDSTLTQLADSLLPHTKEGSAERLWCYIYTGDTAGVRQALELDATRKTKIGRSALAYFADVEAEQRRRDSLKSDLQITVTAKLGNWVPTGDLKAVGTRLYADAAWNWYFGDHLIEIECGIAWQDANTLLQVEHEGRIDSTDHFRTIHFAVNSGYRLLDFGPLTTYAIGGIGVASVTPIESNNSGFVNRKYIESFMMGIGLRQLVGAKRHRGIFGQVDLRYNMMWLDNRFGSSLDGNVLTITAGVGYHFWD